MIVTNTVINYKHQPSVLINFKHLFRASTIFTQDPTFTFIFMQTNSLWTVLFGCDEVRIGIRWHSNFERFQQIRNSTNVLSALLSNANLCLKNPCSTIDFICTEKQRAQTNLFFLKLNVQLFLLSDVLHCTNMNTDFTDFRKWHIVTIILIDLNQSIMFRLIK